MCPSTDEHWRSRLCPQQREQVQEKEQRVAGSGSRGHGDPTEARQGWKWQLSLPPSRPFSVHYYKMGAINSCADKLRIN